MLNKLINLMKIFNELKRHFFFNLWDKMFAIKKSNCKFITNNFSPIKFTYLPVCFQSIESLPQKLSMLR